LYICVLTDIADAICFLLVGPSDLAAKSSVEVFTFVESLSVNIGVISAEGLIVVDN